MTEIDEKALLTKAAEGDMASFEPIVTKYRQQSYQYAVSIMRNHHDALELSQDAFAKAYRNLNKFDLERPFHPWFFKILRNLCLNRIQKNKRRADNPGPVEGMEIIQFKEAPGAKPFHGIERKELASQIDHAMQKLTPEQREILHLRHFKDNTYEEIADIVGIPIGTVMSRLFNARKKLGEILKKEQVV